MRENAVIIVLRQSLDNHFQMANITRSNAFRQFSTDDTQSLQIKLSAYVYFVTFFFFLVHSIPPLCGVRCLGFIFIRHTPLILLDDGVIFFFVDVFCFFLSSVFFPLVPFQRIDHNALNDSIASIVAVYVESVSFIHVFAPLAQ